MVSLKNIKTQEQFTSLMYRTHYENQKELVKTIMWGIVIGLLIIIFV